VGLAETKTTEKKIWRNMPVLYMHM